MSVSPPVRELETNLESRLDSVRLRRLAAALGAFGVLGLMVLGLTAIVAINSFNSIAPVSDTVESERQQIVVMLRDTAQAVRDAGQATTNAGASLGDARNSTTQAAGLTRTMATTMRGIAAASQISIFGSRPLAGMSQGFTDAADQSEKLATTLDAAAAALGANSADVTRVRGDLDRVAAEVDQLGKTVAAMPPIADALSGAGALRWVFALLVLWLMVPAIASLGAGIWLWRFLDRRDARARQAVSG